MTKSAGIPPIFLEPTTDCVAKGLPNKKGQRRDCFSTLRSDRNDRSSQCKSY
ncbi:hypothetical protein [Nostoc sp.]|uniref:hypothetical protein n=1 Tax=Nostoc sp. TaxID=1180 RepID=UPI002FF6D0CB